MRTVNRIASRDASATNSALNEYAVIKQNISTNKSNSEYHKFIKT